ncbi:MAG: polyphosphate kinase 2 [Ignavibacteriae bacterium]|nr:polyphosphate kinase 2 [Ignavibacteriota bacterium]
MGNKKDKEEKKERKDKKNKDEKQIEKYNKKGRISNEYYEHEIAKLQSELVKLQYWVKHKQLKVVLIMEGRDAAGKGGTIKRITEPLNPRGCRIVALEKPSDKERGQWYYERYIQNLPSAGEIVIFDRSWYNRAGVEHVMGFCTDEEYEEFLRSCPEFERMLVRSGIILLKYWFSVSDEEQERRLKDRVSDPAKRWKFSPMDLESWNKWVEFSKAKDTMFQYTDIKQAPWYVVESDEKKKARLNCIAHILSMISYKDVTPEPFELPARKIHSDYIRPPKGDQNLVPEVY